MTCRYTVLLLGLLVSLLAEARPLPPEQVPEPLRTWIPWVLYGQEQSRCPLLFNNQELRLCAWPSPLVVRLDSHGGGFSQTWQVYATGAVPLPGDGRHWPLAVQVDGKPATVLEREGVPVVVVLPGNHNLAGQFAWGNMPESLPVPSVIALLSLQLQGQIIAEPHRDTDGRLWLGARNDQPVAVAGEPLRIQVFRHLDDATPLLLTTRLFLDVSGKARELLLADPLPEGLLPLALTSDLPARLEQGGALRVQLRPGRWQLDLTARSSKPMDNLKRPLSSKPWPDDEVWSFQAHNEQRLVEVAGAPALDPSQANVPAAWHTLPAYQIEASGGLNFHTVRRGDPEPEPDALSLRRQLWLDFAGGGYTASDSITGRLSRSWRLEAAAGFEPGRASVDGEPRLITLLPGGNRPGVELRHGNLNLSADGRLVGDIRHISATGWAQEFQQVTTELHLPPGWRLLAAAGVDNVPDTWVGRWTLLDLFVVLILTLAVGRLWGKLWAYLALAALVLLWHEPGAPRYVWMNLLVVIALQRVLTGGTLLQWVRAYGRLCWLALAVIALPFMAGQVRQGIYPQLESGSAFQGATHFGRGTEAAPTPQSAALPEEQDQAMAGEPRALSKPMPAMHMTERKSMTESPTLPDFDPSARIQTGPGVPEWRWRSVQLSWNGPVAQGQGLRLYLLSPGATLLCNLLRVALLVLLVARLADWSKRWRLKSWFVSMAPVVWLLPLLLVQATPVWAELPDDQRLEQLRQHLLEAPECLPRCADLAVLSLEAGTERLALSMEWHAAVAVAVPLPAVAGEWLPETVMVDGKAAQGVVGRDDGSLWLGLSAGVHSVVLEGRLPDADKLRLPLAVHPHRAVAHAQGWQVEGIRDNQADSQLRLLRQEGVAQASLPGLRPTPLPPFVRLERTLELGLDWRVHTRVLRLSPPGAAVSLDIPLLEGEAVTTAGVNVAQGKVSASLLPQQTQLAWDSLLEQRPELFLTAAASTAWQEVWELRASPVWHVQWQGIAPVHQRTDLWAPQWYPWPGESVALHIGRPEGVAGTTLTVDRSRWQVRPGADVSDATLELTLRSSHGGQHPLVLPDGANLQRVSIDGVLQPVRAKGRQVALPLQPGVQQVLLQWQEPLGISTGYRLSMVDLGSDSVNSHINLQLARDRWVLLVGGPLLGPAVLFWGVLLVLVLVAVGLGRILWTPLRTRHWLLLLLGFSQSSVYAGLLMVGWLLAMGLRSRKPDTNDQWFNLRQVALGLYTLAALAVLFGAVSQGLLGWPDMQVAGNGSTAQLLQWYQDRSEPLLSQPWVVSLPLYAYRATMLAWALWLAWALLDWLRWAWGCYTSGGLWRVKPKVLVPGGEVRLP